MKKTISKFTKELADINQKLAEAPRDIALLKKRAELYSNHRDYSNSLKDLQAAFALDSNGHEILCSIGYVKMMQKEYAEALDYANKCIELEPTQAVFYSNRGQIYFEMKKYAEALEDFKKAFEINPGCTLAKDYIDKITLKQTKKNKKNACRGCSSC